MRLGDLLLLAVMLAAGLGVPAHAEPFRPGQALDQEQVVQVTAAALAFMAPRILDPIPVAQLTMWGLRGLTTLDSRLSPTLSEGSLRLALTEPDGERLLLSEPAPGLDDAAGWGDAAGAAIRAGWNASQAVRDARTGGVIGTFFDELFNHLDPYSRYAPPAEAAEEAAARNGTAGPGIDLAARGGGFVVAAVQRASPAAAAGLRPGATLLAIDGEPVSGSDLAALQAGLAGPPDSAVTLDLRDGAGGRRTLRLIRAPLDSGTVQAQASGAALVLRISAFSGDTGAMLAQAIARGLAGRAGRRVRGLVLDLRGNRGGVLAQAAQSASAFLPRGVVAWTAGRDALATHAFRVDGADVSRGLPVVVLVDGRSASAAEILAAALADQGRAVVVGSATLGKGLVQTVLSLPNGGALYVTWSRVLAPLGWPIQGLGVLPQVCTSTGRDATDQQLAALAQGGNLMAPTLRRARESRPPLAAAEVIDIRMSCPAAVGRELDARVAGVLIDHPAAYAAALLAPTWGAPAPPP